MDRADDDSAHLRFGIVPLCGGIIRRNWSGARNKVAHRSTRSQHPSLTSHVHLCFSGLDRFRTSRHSNLIAREREGGRRRLSLTSHCLEDLYSAASEYIPTTDAPSRQRVRFKAASETRSKRWNESREILISCIVVLRQTRNHLDHPTFDGL